MDCHPTPASSDNAIEDMSGEHEDHILDEGAECYECHFSVLDASFAWQDETLHVNGEPDVALAPETGMTISAVPAGAGATAKTTTTTKTDEIHW
jgi:hypothetical protein